MPTVGVIYEPNVEHQTQLVHNAIDTVCDKLEEMDSDSDSDSDSECDIRVSENGTVHCGTDEYSTLENIQESNDDNSDDNCIGEVRFPQKETKPVDEFQKEQAWMARAFPHLFPFGLCSYNNPNRPHKLEDFPAYIVHLMRLSYETQKDSNGNSKIVNPFQDATFIHYCHNRMQRHRLAKRFYYYLQHSASDELRSSTFTVGHLRKLGAKKIAQYVQHGVVRVRANEGDPAHLNRVASDFRSFTYEYEAASEFSTTSFNDHNIMKMHKTEILNYKPDDEIEYGDGNRWKILDRRKMARRNPATVSFWFFLKQLLRRDILSKHNYPISYVKWFLAKYEDQFRGTMHEHILQKLVFLFLNKTGYKEWCAWKQDTETIENEILSFLINKTGHINVQDR